MPSLSEVRGPTSCISTLINNSPITHASIHHECSADVDLPLPRVLRAISTSSAPLCVLQMDFDPTDYDIVAQIAVAAPGLNALKLIEKGRKVSVRSHINSKEPTFLLILLLYRLVLRICAVHGTILKAGPDS